VIWNTAVCLLRTLSCYKLKKTLVFRTRKTHVIRSSYAHGVHFTTFISPLFCALGRIYFQNTRALLVVFFAEIFTLIYAYANARTHARTHLQAAAGASSASAVKRTCTCRRVATSCASGKQRSARTTRRSGGSPSTQRSARFARVPCKRTVAATRFVNYSLIARGLALQPLSLYGCKCRALRKMCDGVLVGVSVCVLCCAVCVCVWGGGVLHTHTHTHASAGHMPVPEGILLALFDIAQQPFIWRRCFRVQQIQARCEAERLEQPQGR
jgi:hypothetical protein